MAAPIFKPGNPGNLIPKTTLPPQKSVAAFLDLSTAIEGRVTIETVTGAVPPTGSTLFSCNEIYGQTTLTVFTNSNTISVTNTVGINVGQKLLLVGANTELATVTAILGNALTLTPLQYNYADGNVVYLVTQTPTFPAEPRNPQTNTYTANGDFSVTLFLGPAQWCVSAINNDISVTTTVLVSVNTTPGIA